VSRARDLADAGSKANFLDNVTANIPADVDGTYAPKASPTFTGTVSGVTPAHLGLGVTDITSSFALNSNWSAWITDKCFLFNGFVFVQLNAYIASTSSHWNSTTMGIYTISDSNYYPAYEASLPTTSYQDDIAQRVQITTGGVINIKYPREAGSDANYHVIVNGWYRI